MAKEKTVYVCSNCGQDSPKWVGKCPSCGEWNTYVEEIVRKEPVNRRPVSGIETQKPKPVILSEIIADDEPRINMHDNELNRTGRRTCSGFFSTDRRRTGNRKINSRHANRTPYAGKENPLCIRRGKCTAIKITCRPSF